MTLVLHAGAEETDYTYLRQMETPPATPTHVPLPHFRLVDLVVHSLSYYGHEVREQHHGVTPDGNRYFGVLTIRSPYTGYEDMVGLRNSHDKSLPVGIAFGSHVFVCDNTAFIADHVIRTKHTAKLKLRLPGLVGELIEPLTEQREAQARTIERYRSTDLRARDVDHAIMSLYREGVINVTRIADVMQEWEAPSFEEFAERHNAWRLFNAVTFVLTGRIAENPQATTKLHRVIDGVCETVH
jgi:hypothetical protein